MRPVARARALDQQWDLEIRCTLAQRHHIVSPGGTVQIDRHEPACVVRQQRIDPDRLPALEMRTDLRRRERDESPARAVCAFDLRLEARSWSPLVGTARCPTRPAWGLRALPSCGEHIRAPAEQRLKQRHAALGGPNVGSARRRPHRSNLSLQARALLVKRFQTRLRSLQIENLHDREWSRSKRTSL